MMTASATVETGRKTLRIDQETHPHRPHQRPR